MNEFQEIRNQNLEIMTFQRNMLLICKDIVKNRESSSDARAKYVYTSDVAVSCEPPPVVRKRLESGNYLFLFLLYLYFVCFLKDLYLLYTYLQPAYVPFCMHYCFYVSEYACFFYR